MIFQSTQPKRAATQSALLSSCAKVFQSTQPKRAATAKERKDMRNGFISIHAAQEGCDKAYSGVYSCFGRFQSTQPKRAATQYRLQKAVTAGKFQSTQPKRAATTVRITIQLRKGISIHAAQEGCDTQSQKHRQDSLLFQSTQPKRAATGYYFIMRR